MTLHVPTPKLIQIESDIPEHLHELIDETVMLTDDCATQEKAVGSVMPETHLQWEVALKCKERSRTPGHAPHYKNCFQETERINLHNPYLHHRFFHEQTHNEY